MRAASPPEEVASSVEVPREVARDRAATDKLDELRALLNVEERARIDELERRGLSAKEIAELLPEAILERQSRDDRVARALESTIESGLFASARKDPKTLADAIHPALGPAIRAMIQSTLRDSFERLNVTLENAVSPQGIRWRMQAARTGRPFSEVVLLATMVYRVEQVLLIHAETGLVVREARALDATENDSDLVAGMLTAIRDFAEDSFSGDTSDATAKSALEEIEFEGRTILLAQGAAASLALVVSGNPPRLLRQRATEALDEIHLTFGHELGSFSGEDDALPSAVPLLEDLLLQESKEMKSNPWVRLIPIAIAAGLLLWLVVSSVSSYRVHKRIASLEDALKGAPGIRLLDVSYQGGAYLVSGLADPLAPESPAEIARGALGLDVRVDMDVEPIVSLHESCVLQRARQMLALPASTPVLVNDGALIVYGMDPESEHADNIQKNATFVPGVERVSFRP